MKNGRNYWAEHVEAIKSQGVSTSAYARQHGISVAALYYWQRKLQAQVVAHSVALAAPKPQSKFVAVRVNDALEQMAQPSWGCTLVLGGGMRLEMSALPDPQWLVAVGRANQGVH
jgi:hypothetical protein